MPELLAEIDFLLVQLITLHSTTGPHRMREHQMRMAALHRRLDHLERQLRMRVGEDDLSTLGQLRRRLDQVSERRQRHDPDYAGPERRRHQRREPADSSQSRL